MCDRSWACCPPRTKSLTSLCCAAVMCLPDAPDLTLLILCSSCHTKALVGCKLYKSQCLVCLWLAVPLKHFITNRTHGISNVYSVSQCTTSSKAKSNQNGHPWKLEKKSDIMTWVWISSTQSRAQENPSRKTKNVTLFCHTQSPAKYTWSKVKATLSDSQTLRMHFAVWFGRMMFWPLLDLKCMTFSWTRNSLT